MSAPFLPGPSDIRGDDIRRLLEDVSPDELKLLAFALAEAGVQAAGQSPNPEEDRPLLWTLSRAALGRVHSRASEYAHAWHARALRSGPWLRLEVLGHIENDLEPLLLLLEMSHADGVFVRSLRGVEPVGLGWPPRIRLGRETAMWLSEDTSPWGRVSSETERCDVLVVAARELEDYEPSELRATVVIALEEGSCRARQQLSRSEGFWRQSSVVAVAMIVLPEQPDAARQLLWELGRGMGRGLPLDVILTSGLMDEATLPPWRTRWLAARSEFLDSFRRQPESVDSRLSQSQWFLRRELLRMQVLRSWYGQRERVAEALWQLDMRSLSFSVMGGGVLGPRRGRRPALKPLLFDVLVPEPVFRLRTPGPLTRLRKAGRAAWRSVRGRGSATAQRIREALLGPIPRFLQATVLTPMRERCEARQTLEPETSYRVTAFIGPIERGTLMAPRALPERLLPARRDGHGLTIVFIPHRGPSGPQTARVLLPRVGRSDSVEFKLRTPLEPGPIDARLLVMFDNRILQTLRLVGYVAARGTTPPSGWELELRSESVLRAHFDEIEVELEFDAAFVINEDSRGQPALTRVRNGRVIRFGIEGLAGAMEAMDAHLETLAACESLGESAARESLRALARHAASLHQELQTHQVRTPPKGARLQVLSAHAAARFPLELVYDRTPPLETAELCSNASRALAEGGCLKSCQKNENVVCPFGFWGIRYTIERQVRDLGGAAKLGLLNWKVKPAHARRSKWLSFPRNVVLGYSKVVGKKQIHSVTSSLSAKLRPSKAVDGPDWAVWRENVKRVKPGLLVLVAHAALDGDGIPFLEIGGERRGLINLDEGFVGRSEPRPIVLLLACEQGRNTIPFQSAAARFNQLRVPATIAPSVTIYAPRALEVVDALVETMVRAAESEKCLGDVMAELRRAHLWSNPMVLSLVSYGDADVRLCLPSRKKRARGR